MTTFVKDTFSGSGNLAGRTCDVAGGVWTRQAASGNTLSPTVGSGVLSQGESNSTFNYYYVNTTPPSADYSVTVTINHTSTDTGVIIGGLWGRAPASGNGGYHWMWYEDSIGFYMAIMPFSPFGTAVSLVTSPLATGAYKLTLEMIGSAIKGKVQRLSDNYFLKSDGTFATPEVFCFSATDSTYSAAGYAGIAFQSSGSPGLTYDDFEAYDTGGPSGGGGSSSGAAMAYLSQL